MTTWIFQGNPDRFDIDGYLAYAPDRIAWMVNQYRTKIRPGDQVFLWRARGSGAYGQAGILAECLVDSPVIEMPDDGSSIRFWRSKEDSGVRPRVWLRLVRVSERGTILQRDDIARTPGLETLGPIGFGNATNFEISEDESRELNRIWHSVTRARSEERARAELDDQSAALEQQPLQQLIEEYRVRRTSAQGLPRRTHAETMLFERDPYVRAIARLRAQFRCEVPNCSTPYFVSVSGEPYCEVHHLRPLAAGGEDTIENAACVCANHHRELHVGRRRDELTQLLRTVRNCDNST